MLIYLSVKRESLIIPPPLLLCLLAGFYLLAWLSILWSHNKAETIYAAQKIFCFIVILVIGIDLLRQNGNFEALCRGLTLIAFVTGLAVLIKIVDLDRYDSKKIYDVRLFYEHRNLVASALFLLTAFVFLSFEFEKGLNKMVAGSTLVLLGICLALFQVRSVYLAVGVSVLVLVAAGRRTMRKRTGPILLFILPFLISLALIALLNSGMKEGDAPANRSAASVTERWQLWGKTADLIAESPVLGVGAGNWQFNFMKAGVGDIENVCMNNVAFHHPHNEMLSVISEHGFAGFALLFAAFIIITSHILWHWRKKDSMPLLITSAFLLGILVESCFSFPKERLLHLGLIALLLAILLAQMRMFWRPSEKQVKWMKIFLLTGLGFGVVVGINRMAGEYYFKKMLSAQNAGDPKSQLQFALKANSFFYSSDPTSQPLKSYAGAAAHQLNFDDKALQLSEEAYNLSPFDYKTLNNYAFMLQRHGELKKAILHLDEALRINPCYEPALENMALCQFNAGNFKASLDYLGRLNDYESRYARQVQILKEKMND